VVKGERAAVFGDEAAIANRLAASPGNLINTSYIGRANLNWRLWDARLRRKSLTFAKALRWLEAKMAICVVWRNFIRRHSSLTQVSAIGAQRLTPALAAGKADRPWTIEEAVGGGCIIN
jgi:hypothetical protein